MNSNSDHLTAPVPSEDLPPALPEQPDALARATRALLSKPGCERVREFSETGPVQRASVELLVSLAAEPPQGRLAVQNWPSAEARWVSVKDRLPEGGNDVFVYMPLPGGAIFRGMAAYWWCDDDGPSGPCWQEDGVRLSEGHLPTHWMDPAPPEGMK